MRRVLAGILLLSTLPACPTSDTCDEADRKDLVMRYARSWYLYQDLLPEEISPDDFPSAQALLDALTFGAREQGRDRGWSYLLSKADFQRYFEGGQSIGFGFGWASVEEGAFRVLVKQVFAGSAAAIAGFARGDEILAVGPNATSLSDVALLGEAGFAQASSAGGRAGVSRTFLVLPRGGGEAVVRTIRSAAFDVDPVPPYRILNGGTTGYVQLRTFIEPAEAPLRAAFRAFREAGVQNVVVDLRYNGGGSVDTAVILADLLAPELAGQEMFSLHHNASHAESDVYQAFEVEPDGATFQRVAFITTRASASASELVPNALDAHRAAGTLALVGDRTYGKPVGQYAIDLGDCDTMLFLVSFWIENADGVASYFEGLPVEGSSTAPLCDAPDDLTHEMDSEEEGSTAAALYFVEHGECPSSPALRAAPVTPRLRQPAGSGATPAERDMPGTI